MHSGLSLVELKLACGPRKTWTAQNLCIDATRIRQTPQEQKRAMATTSALIDIEVAMGNMGCPRWDMWRAKDPETVQTLHWSAEETLPWHLPIRRGRP